MTTQRSSDAAVTTTARLPFVAPSQRWWLLVGVLVLSEACYVALLRLDAVNGVRPVFTFLALMGGLFALYAVANFIVRDAHDHRRGLWLVILTGAVLFRLTLLPAGLPHDATPPEYLAAARADVRGEAVVYEPYLLFDNDLWRYLWDGHVQAHGLNPYSHAPANAALDDLIDSEKPELTDGRTVWGDIRDNINYALTPTIYPPLAQAVFRLSHWLAPGSVLTFKAVVVGFDLLAVLLIALTLRVLNRPMLLVLLYAWNPLVIKVFAASGHADAVVVALIAATAYFIGRGSPRLAAVSFALAMLAKLSPLVLLPFVVRRVGWRNAALVGAVFFAGYVPFLDAGRDLFGGLFAFASEWQFNAGTFALLRWSAGAFSDHPALIARALSALLLVGFVGWLAWRDDGRNASFAKYAAAALGALVVFSPTVMPWYIAWVLPLAVIAGQRLWLYFSALVCLAFLVMIDGSESPLTLWLEYGCFAVLLWHERRRPKRAARTRPDKLLPVTVNQRLPLGSPIHEACSHPTKPRPDTQPHFKIATTCSL